MTRSKTEIHTQTSKTVLSFLDPSKQPCTSLKWLWGGPLPPACLSPWLWLALERVLAPAVLGWGVNLRLPSGFGCVCPHRAMACPPHFFAVDLQLDSLGPVCPDPRKSKSQMCAGADQGLGLGNAPPFTPSAYVLNVVCSCPGLLSSLAALCCPKPRGLGNQRDRTGFFLSSEDSGPLVPPPFATWVFSLFM